MENDLDYFAALRLVENGSFAGLVLWMRAGKPIEGELAAALVEILDPDGKSDWRVDVRERFKNVTTESWRRADRLKQLRIGAWAVAWTAARRGEAKQVNRDIAVEFGVGEGKVREAKALFRRAFPKDHAFWSQERAPMTVNIGMSDDELELRMTRAAFWAAKQAVAAICRTSKS